MLKKLVPYCPICNQDLSGNNSLALPYECECGIWDVYLDEDNELQWKIIKENK